MNHIPAIIGSLIILCLSPLILLLAILVETFDWLMGYPEPRK